MAPRHAPEDKLQQLLKQAYGVRVNDAAPVGEAPALMRRIRHLAGPEERALPGVFLDRLFWRLVPAAGALIAILAMVALNLDFIPDAEVWSMLHYENEAAAMMQILLL